MTNTDGNTDRDAPPPGGLPRFSLFTLLVVVTLCAGLFGLTRIVGNIVLVWIGAAQTAGVLVGLVFGLVCRQIKRAVLGACIGSTLTTGFPLMFIVLMYLGVARQPLALAPNRVAFGTAIAIAIFGSLGGMVGGAVGGLDNDRHSPEEVGLLWGAGVGGSVVLIPYALVMAGAILSHGIDAAGFLSSALVALGLIMIAATIGGVGGLIIAALVRLFLGEQQSSRTPRKYIVDPPPEIPGE